MIYNTHVEKWCLSLLFWNHRTATLVLAVLGAVTHLYGAMTLTALSDEFDDADTGAVLGLTAYSYLSGFACLAGAVGVLKVNKDCLGFLVRSSDVC